MAMVAAWSVGCAALLRSRIPGARVRIVGKGPEWERVVRLHAALGLGETVSLLGDVSRERLAEEYVSADLFCLPSVQESLGIVFLEAMAIEALASQRQQQRTTDIGMRA